MDLTLLMQSLFYLAVAAFLILCSRLIRTCLAVSDRWTSAWRDGERIRVRLVFIRCDSMEDARRQAQERGMGAEPVLHPPHRVGNPDFYWHFHVGNHELLYNHAEQRWENVHWYFEDDEHSAGNLGRSGDARRRG